MKPDPTHPDYRRGYNACVASVRQVKAALDLHEAVAEHEARSRAITDPHYGLGWLAAETHNYQALSAARVAVAK